MFSKKSSTSQVARLHISLLIASFLIYLGGQIWQCVSWPPFYSFDETLEIDYVYQLSQGHLPTFFGGAEFNPLDLQYPYDVQWRYQHPPLFYSCASSGFSSDRHFTSSHPWYLGNALRRDGTWHTGNYRLIMVGT